MRIAIYQGLPAGGARHSIEAIVSILHKNHEVRLYSSIPEEIRGPLARIRSDWRSLVGEKKNQKEIAEQIDSGKYDVVFVTHDRFLQSPWVMKYLRTPIVFLCQEPTRQYYEYFLKIPEDLPLPNKLYEMLNRFLRKKIESDLARKAKVIVSNSYFSTESIFRAYGVYSTTVYLGVNTDEFYDMNLTKNHQVLVVGNDEPQKDLDLAIKTISLIKENRPKLIIKSPRQYDTKRVEGVAKQHGVDLEIIFNQTPDQLRKLYCESKITLATAHLEPFGLSAIESMACGTPVVAVREGGFRESVIDGETGILVDRNPVLLAAACEELLNNPDRARSLGVAGEKYVNTNFTWEKTVEHLVKLFEDAKKRKRRHHHSKLQ